MTFSQNRREALLAFKRLDAILRAEDRGCGIEAVSTISAAPAAGHPVIPHEVWSLLEAGIASADEQILEIEGASHGAFWQDFCPETEHRVHQLFKGTRTETGAGAWPLSIDNGSRFTQIDRHRTIEAGV